MTDTELKVPKTREEIHNEQLTQIVDKGIVKHKLAYDGSSVFDLAYERFRPSTTPTNTLTKEEFVKSLLTFFYKIDPTTNKEYVRWFIKLYSEFLKQRIPLNDTANPKWIRLRLAENITEILTADTVGGKNYLFFEDFFKLTDYIEIYERLKTMRVEICKDILEYNDYRDFMDVVQPFKLMLVERDDKAENTKPGVIKLDFDSAELEALNNAKDYIYDFKLSVNDRKLFSVPMAKIVYEDKNWYVVHTINREANKVFGKYTEWCTAGTRYSGDMFESYACYGPLFVCIKKGHTTKSDILKDKLNRLQFTFDYSDHGMYMDAADKPVTMSKFLMGNLELRDFFRKYVSEYTVTNKGDLNKIIGLIKHLGFVEDLIPILKDSNIETLKLDELIEMENIQVSLIDNIGIINSLKNLTIARLNLNELPKTIDKLSNLNSLNIANNNIEDPSKLYELNNLMQLILLNNKIKQIDLSNFKNLYSLSLDNNPLEEIIDFPEDCRLANLHLNGTNIKVIDKKYGKLKKLVLFDLSQSAVNEFDLSILDSMTELKSLNLSNTQLSSKQIEMIVKYRDSKGYAFGIIDITNNPPLR